MGFRRVSQKFPDVFDFEEELFGPFLCVLHGLVVWIEVVLKGRFFEKIIC